MQGSLPSGVSTERATRTVERVKPWRRPTDDEVYLAFRDVDASLRREMPDVFARVDAIRAQPGWSAFSGRPETGGREPPLPSWDRAEECEWCGDDFLKASDLKQRFCSRPCALAYQAWERGRATPRS